MTPAIDARQFSKHVAQSIVQIALHFNGMREGDFANKLKHKWPVHNVARIQIQPPAV